MTGRSPQVLLTLNANDELVLELAQGPVRHSVVLRSGDAEETLLRVLRAQREQRVELGLDGAPTQAQVTHWERHQVWADERCRFCIAEGRVHGRSKRTPRTRIEKRPDGVEVRVKRVAEGQSGADARVTWIDKSLEELGL
jgi:hypothetical protein